MKTGHEQTFPRKLVGHDHVNGYWWCPVCGEPYDGPSGRRLAQECLNSHNGLNKESGDAAGQSEEQGVPSGATGPEV